MNFKTLLASALGALAFCGAANAAVLSTTNVAPHNIVTDYSTGSLVSFDLDLGQLRNTKLTYTIEAADLSNPFLNLNVLVRNVSGKALSTFGFVLEGITFGGASGSVTPAFGSVDSVVVTPAKLDIAFGSSEYAELQVGNPFADAGKFDWQLSTAGLSVGDQFIITAEVPEPGNVALMLAGLAAFGFAARRRYKN